MIGKQGSLFGLLVFYVRSTYCQPEVRVNKPNLRVYLIKIQIFTQFYLKLSIVNNREKNGAS